MVPTRPPTAKCPQWRVSSYPSNHAETIIIISVTIIAVAGDMCSRAELYPGLFEEKTLFCVFKEPRAAQRDTLFSIGKVVNTFLYSFFAGQGKSPEAGLGPAICPQAGHHGLRRSARVQLLPD